MRRSFTPREVAQILEGPISYGSGEGPPGLSTRVYNERLKITKRFCELHKPNIGSVQHGARAQARAEWISQNLIVDRAFLCFYSEGHGSTVVVGVFPTEKAARSAGKGKDWYGGDCGVEKHRVGGPVVYDRSSKVIAPAKKPAKKRTRAG